MMDNWKHVIVIGILIGIAAVIIMDNEFVIKPLREDNYDLTVKNTQLLVDLKETNNTLNWMNWAMEKAIRNCTFNCTS